MRHDFQRVAIVNRGEAAMRFIHAAREFNQEYGTALRTIALFTEPDCRAMFVREADEAFCLGPAHLIDAHSQQQKSSYVDYDTLQKALVLCQAEGVWPGWGFVAEHANFAELCRHLGIVFIGPEADVMRRVGDKIASKLLAEEAQLPVVPWSGGPVESIREAERHAARLGYPFFFKATAGGGGHGIRFVESPSELAQAFERARSEAFKAFGNGTVFMEQGVPKARHVEVQVIADHYGTTWAVGVRDCTIQRRHQKIMEEAPSPALTSEQYQALCDAAVTLARAAGYQNAGTVEFLYEPDERRFLFMEMNTRLQVEHPVTECTTGYDLVKLQIHVARGGKLSPEPPRSTGHAIEVRLNAEDPDNSFAPAPGIVERFRIVGGPGVRVDTGLAEGDSVPAEFDSMIAKIIGYGRTRQEALARLCRTLRDSVVVIKGGTSNKSFLLQLLNRAEVQQANVDTGWLDQVAENGEHVCGRYAEVALVQAAINAYDAALAIEQSQFYASAVRGRPQVRREIGRTVALCYSGNSYSLKVSRIGPNHYQVELDGVRIDALVNRVDGFQSWLTVAERRFNIVSTAHELNYRIEVDGFSHRIDRDDGGIVYAPAPAVVVSVAVKPGDEVSVGERLAVLEAMKMEMPVVATFSGCVRSVMTIANVQVDTGTPLIQIERTSTEAETHSSERLEFADLVRADEESVTRADSRYLEEVQQFMLGFDVDPAQIARLLGKFTQAHHTYSDSPAAQKRQDEILNIFVDVCSLFQRDKVPDHSSGETPSAEAHLFAYLRTLDVSGEGLPSSFIEAVRRALAHYGVNSLKHTPQLEQSLLWLYKSHQRVEHQVAPILNLLERRLEQAEVNGHESFRTLLDRMISVTNGLFPAISDMAREVRYRCFDQPLFERTRKQIYGEAEGHLNYLAQNPHGPERQDKIRALIDCPQPLLNLFSAYFGTADEALEHVMLEVLTKRYYGFQSLEKLRSHRLDGHIFVSAEYEDDGKRVHLITTRSPQSALLESARKLFPLLEKLPAEEDVALDLYVSQSDGQHADEIEHELQILLNQAGFPRPIERIVVAVGAPNGAQQIHGNQHFTYRLCEGSYKEKKFYRGVHPMIGKRLQLWRLANFKIDRLPSAEDVYLLHAVGRENAKDERLFAVAEVRDLTPVRDETGRIVQLPHLERMFAEALAGIRRFQSRRAPHERLLWNRILLYVWPALHLETDEFQNILDRLTPGTEGLGIEQVVVRARTPNPETGELRDTFVRISSPGGSGLLVTFRPASKLQPVKPLSEYDQKVIRMRRRGLMYPYEIVKMLTPSAEDTRAEFPAGDFVEYDLDEEAKLVPVHRPYGENKANIIVGVIRSFTEKYREGMTRVIVLGDPSKDLGAIAEPECRRIMAALDLAAAKRVPLEWFAISAGAKISMDSGVENMDWIARVLRRLVEFTQSGGEVNLIVNGINVGAQPYWNAESTMLMHTRGILVMTPSAAMVLTGKRALDYSGSVSADDNQGIGGYDRIMGVNGQAQYWAGDIDEACQILLRHYEHTYVMPGERFPRPSATSDAVDRDVRAFPHKQNGEEGFGTIGDIFSDETNPGRKKSFEIRRVMMSVIDQDHGPLERWAGMKDAETAVVWDAHLGGQPVCLLGIESRPIARLGFVPADGPDQWTAGTLFPLSSKKAARAINAASNNRPVVILANLSGFDGSPESMRKLQLEYGAEIGRAVVNFKGPMVFCVVSRYHGGAYVVFSRMLNEGLEVAALEGTYASVIGGAPAAAVVFASEVEARTRKDARLMELQQAIAKADGVEKGRLRKQWEETFKVVHSEKLGEMAAEFDRIHSVHRALAVGALNHIIPAAKLRPYLIDAVRRGMGKELKPAMETTVAKVLPIKRVAVFPKPGALHEGLLVGTDGSGSARRK
ncbi:MAG TPA: carboxyl transferase domain-containing protein [Terriglobales bacterium]|nr:carboxyl transferase domain-containing protein [Terriglobales bacterium]